MLGYYREPESFYNLFRILYITLGYEFNIISIKWPHGMK